MVEKLKATGYDKYVNSKMLDVRFLFDRHVCGAMQDDRKTDCA